MKQLKKQHSTDAQRVTETCFKKLVLRLMYLFLLSSN